MVKGIKKPKKTQTNTINSISRENKTSPKPRKQIYSENYQKNKEHKKQQRRERYQQQKLEASKYCQVSNIKVLLSLKEYTELSKQTKKTWLDFTATLHELSQGITAIEEVMRLEQLAGQLIKDYRETAKGKEKKESKSWNVLEPEQQAKLIKYWGREKARIENNLLTTAERLEQQGQQYEKEIELAKFHEERGKIKCPCYDCETKKEIQLEVKAKIKKEMDNYDRKSGTNEKEKCPECGKLRVLDEEAGVCKNYVKKNVKKIIEKDKQKHQFKTIYCDNCKQRKSCAGFCCSCQLISQ